MVDASSSLFFLPHKPRGSASLTGPPLFLFMKGTGWFPKLRSRHSGYAWHAWRQGTRAPPNDLDFFFFSKFPATKPDLTHASFLLPGWCGAGADHYEPILAKQKAKSEDGEKPAIAL